MATPTFALGALVKSKVYAGLLPTQPACPVIPTGATVVQSMSVTDGSGTYQGGTPTFLDVVYCAKDNTWVPINENVLQAGP